MAQWSSNVTKFERQAVGDRKKAPLRLLRFAARGVRTVWLQLGIALLMLICLELAARAYEHAAGAKRDEDTREQADAYANAPWAKEVLQEYTQRSVRWQRYVYWIGAPFESRYTNVSTQGLRATWRSPAASQACPRLVRIFMFGGSTMWGEGARDDDTIASWLQRMLVAKGSCARVTNFGQDGYVSTQEMILLAEEIQNGNVPDLAIFYDGYNDAHSALNNNAAGLTYDEDARRREFNMGNLVTPEAWGQLATHWMILIKVSVKDFVHSLGLSSLARRIVAKWSPGTYIDVHGVLVKAPGYEINSSQATALENATARDYLVNVGIVEGLAHQFGFRRLFYWQPWLGDKVFLSPYERQQMQGLMPGQRDFVEAVRQRVAERNTNGEVRFLSDVFSNRPEPYFIDEVHVTGVGNRLIAERMLPDVLNVIAEINSGSPSATRSDHARAESGEKSVGEAPRESQTALRSPNAKIGTGGGMQVHTLPR